MELTEIDRIDSTLDGLDGYSLYIFVLECKARIEENYYFLGKTLKTIHDTKKYRKVASHIETWDDFLREVGISHGKAHYLMEVVECFDAQLKTVNFDYFPPVSRLIQLLPYTPSMTEEEKAEWIEKAKLQSLEHWRSEMQLLAGGVDREECPHDGDVLVMEKCLKCGKFLKVS